MEKKKESFHLLRQNAHKVSKIAFKLAGKLHKGDTIFLKGPVGVGKSYFARNFILENLKQQKLSDEVPSPSFSLIQIYDHLTPRICHVDLYRLSYISELEELGLDYIYRDSVILIEWPERMESRLPERFFQIEFSFNDKKDCERDLSIVFEGANWDHVISILN